MMIDIKLKNFYTEIETMCITDNIDAIDAILIWCERNNFEVESVASMIKENSVMLSKITEEAENLNFLKKTAKLPI